MRLSRLLRISVTPWYRGPINPCKGWLKLLWILPFLPITLMVILNTMPDCEISERFGASKDELTKPIQYNYTVHPDERAFPLAFSIVVYRDLDRALRLLHAIHRPHNCYCIHMDRRITRRFREILELEVRKRYTSEVFVMPEDYSFTVRWGTMSVLDADLMCSRILLARCPDWTYWINLTGQEFPLRTNRELVTALKLLNGSNVIDGTFKNRMYSRFPLYYRLNFSFTWYKGSVHIAARRDFVQFMHTDIRAKQMLQVLRVHDLYGTWHSVPDETFFSTLNHNPYSIPAPGAFLGEHERHTFKQVTRFKIWTEDNEPCGSGCWIRQICMLGLNDIPRLIRSPQFFANKFVPYVQPEAYDLMERWLANKLEYENRRGDLHPSFNRTYYSTLEVSWNHI
ncbi:hypothetical protein P879_09430 [Paragonimus westermani]|uniref:Beta-1,3-galactosyl-O-glycosyl-glycoprotein beta-1,6-N-acetylglucosaminyltransferase n=1 Tax=Paragonimus westermani TaxID=34504 RepID=A0A8T0DAL6_9TREM|nr:hypothetical protein P879_09430 [Paragonimus westermani]